jgi:hypothetical protein
LQAVILLFLVINILRRWRVTRRVELSAEVAK